MERCESWIKFHKVYNELTDLCIGHHRTKKHLEDNYAMTFRTMAKDIFIKSMLYQRTHDFRLEGDVWEIEFVLYNEDNQQYGMIMEFPVRKWARIYKLNQLGI